MAGGSHNAIRSDPAVERWSQMHATMYQRFRFTPSATGKVLLFGVAIPAVLYAGIVQWDDKQEWGARQRGQTLAKYEAPASEAAPKEE